jgi:hypothetical protein
MPTVTVNFEAFTDWVRQQVKTYTDDTTWFENKAPGYTALKKAVTTEPITPKGYRIPAITGRPGGHTGYLPSASSFNPAIGPEMASMYVYPTYYALPMVFQGAMIRALRNAPERLMDFNDVLRSYMDAATKRMEYLIYGDGSGALAFSSSTLAVGNGQTMNCTTTAAATFGQTHGAYRLERRHSYHAINTATGLPRGEILVVTEGLSSCVVNVVWGSVSSGDPLTDPNSYNRMMRGLAHLVSRTSRILQGVNTANVRELNSPEVDLNGTLLTPTDFNTAKAMLQTRSNDESVENKLLAFMTYGTYAQLRAQGWNMINQTSSQTVGIAPKFVDGDTVFIRTADMDNDRTYLIHPDKIRMFEEMPLGPLDLDGQEFRMLFGNNGTGSDDWQRALAMAANPGIIAPKSAVLIKRALLTGQVTQLNSF